MDLPPAEILGLDASLTCSGVAKCLADSPDFVITYIGKIKTTPRKNQAGKYVAQAGDGCRMLSNQERYADVFFALLEKGLLTSIEFTCVEDFAFTSFGQGLTDLAELQGFLRMIMYMNKRQWVPISGSSIKKFVSGKGNTKKALIPMFVQDKFAQELLAYGQGLLKGGDEADAVAICAFAHRFWRWRNKLALAKPLTKDEVKTFENVVDTQSAILNLHA